MKRGLPHPISTIEPVRAAIAVVALALFLLGTHLCLVAGLARARGGEVAMSCTASSGARADAATHSCCGGAARHRAPARVPAQSPCCLLLVTADAPSLDVAVAHAPCVALVPEPVLAHAAPSPAVERPLVPDEHAPPGATPRAPLPARAPPVLA